MKILKHPDPLLKRVCDDVGGCLDWAVVTQMMQLLCETHGMGLAAPQVGILKRFFVTYWGEVFVNPRIMRVGNRYETKEGCLSLDGQFPVTRYDSITLATGEEYHGAQAEVIQHELDHLNGRLINGVSI